MNWTQPICQKCNKQNLAQEAYRLIGAKPEVCCFCGKTTTSGIYIHVNPLKVPFPTSRDSTTQ